MPCVTMIIADTSTPLEIVSIEAVSDPTGDILEYNRYGVLLTVILEGDSTKHMKLSWGSDYDEIKTDVSAGTYTYKYNLPPGNHNICAVLF